MARDHGDNRYVDSAVAYKIKGYADCTLFLQGRITEEEDMEQAKNQLIGHMENEIARIKGMPLETYKLWCSRDFNP